MRKLLHITVSLVVLLLAGCSNIEYRSEMPNKEPLLPLKHEKVVAEQRWSTQVGKGARRYDVKLLLAKENNLLAAADARGKVVAIARDSGKQLWSIRLETTISAGPVIAHNKVIVAGDAEIIVLQAEDGTIAWKVPVATEILAAPKIADGVMFAHTLDCGLTALRMTDGRQLWRFSLNMPALILRRSSVPVITKDHVITGFANGKLVAIHRIDGSVDWAQDVTSPTGRTEIQRMVDISADPIVKGNIVYVVSYHGNLAAFTVKTGQLMWERKISSYAGMVIDKNIIYVAASNGYVWAIERNTGNTLWVQQELRGRRLSKPVIQQGFVVVGDEDGYLHWLSTKQGLLEGRFFFDKRGIEAPPIVEHDKLYVYGDSGKVAEIIVAPFAPQK